MVEALLQPAGSTGFYSRFCLSPQVLVDGLCYSAGGGSVQDQPALPALSHSVIVLHHFFCLVSVVTHFFYFTQYDTKI